MALQGVVWYGCESCGRILLGREEKEKKEWGHGFVRWLESEKMKKQQKREDREGIEERGQPETQTTVG